ncbi:pyridoxamine 5'-phosphate oxidase family protein [Nocardia sp. NEAU-G5]|uniref:Pyridoxamine 5'-phosphate oxidase family protein n=1 Tax=Nocardia albiluteola TaxID=2842303 RepID=A0ABS6B1P5_9NOCA|nr:pyridoxamine 5'-phosphate oxidase family protein [Nocardia albiluteola]
MFMTLGNIASDPRCGLLILDWETGALLQVTGTAEINWDERTFATDAQCSIDFAVDEVVEIAHAIPLRWGPSELSPANPMLG